MEKCPYRDIVPENLNLSICRKIIKKFEAKQCPYARARVICQKCTHEFFLDKNTTHSIEKNIRYTHLMCGVCGAFYDIKDAEIICIAGECLLAQEKED